jgi:tetratricopeptide (TPR) repeat protein
MRDGSTEEFGRIADMKQKQAQDKAISINRYFNDGKSYYRSKKFVKSRACFEQILKIEPSYEPAKLYLECVVIQEGILEARGRIEIIKLKMANILAEYDRRVNRMDSLAVKYFLEQAQKECQLGNFKAAEKYYNLCYKIYPNSRVKIEWFVKVTHDLITLYKRLDEESRQMERLISTLK